MVTISKYSSCLFFLIFTAHQLTSILALPAAVGPVVSAGVSFLKDKALAQFKEPDITEQKLDEIIRDMEGKSFWSDKNYHKTLEDLKYAITSAVKVDNELLAFKQHLRVISTQYELFRNIPSDSSSLFNFTESEIQIWIDRTSTTGIYQISKDLLKEYKEILPKLVPSYEVRLIKRLIK